MPAFTGMLKAIQSRRDKAGNCYWAFQYIDFESGKTVNGTVSGGESNIYGILRHMGSKDDWDRSILYSVLDLSKGDFKHLTLGWRHAGCRPEDLANFIKRSLKGE